MNKILMLVGLIVLTGCSNQARLDYYSAVEAAATAQARQSEAKFEALSRMAQGDGEASVAAVMAIALSQERVVQPQFIEDDGLKWAQVLAGPIAAIGSLWIQADLSRDLNANNSRVAVARIEQEATSERALYAALTAPQPTPSPSLGIEGLNVVVDGLVALGAGGMNGIQQVGVAGIDGVGTMGALALGATQQMGVIGLNTVSDTAALGIEGIGAMGGQGFQTVEAIAAEHNMTIKHAIDSIGTCCVTCGCPDTPVVTPGTTDPACSGFSPQPPGCI